MNRWIQSFLFQLLLIASVSYIEPASAEPLPSSAKKNLSQILERKEYQPRRREVSAAEQMWLEIAREIKRYAKGFLSLLPEESAGMNEDSFLSRVIRTIASFLAKVFLVIAKLSKIAFVCALFALVCFLMSKLWRKFYATSDGADDTRLGLLVADASSKEEVSRLLREGDFSKALFLVRQNLRSNLSREFKLSESMSDRMFIVSAPTTISARARELLKEVFTMFEKEVFANQKVSKEEIERVCQTFLEQAP